MAKKPKSPPPSPGALSKTVFLDFLTTTANTKQRVSDAQTDHAREFKKCESLGIHSEATKLLSKLDKMSEEKRADFLHFFDKARPWMGWDEQLDLLDSVDEQAAAGQIPFGDVHEEEERERAPAELTFASAPIEERDPMLEETSQAWASADQTGDEEDLDKGGYTFAVGKAAGLAGKTPEDNPHPADDASHDLWARGQAIGARERTAAMAAEVADELDAGDGGTVFVEQGADDNVVHLFDADDEMPADVLTGSVDAVTHTAAQ